MSNPSKSLSDLELIKQLGRGNPGALGVCVNAMKQPGGAALLASMYDHLPTMRGPEIWVTFKDECEEDINKFLQRIVELCEQ